jgi:hypothetical protein
MDIIRNNLENHPNSFYYSLNEGDFDSIKFKDLTNSICILDSEDLSQLDRLLKSIELWDLGFSIEKLISCHFDKNDVYKISNLSDTQVRQLSQVIYYFCNWFSYNKKIEKDLLEMDKW